MEKSLKKQFGRYEVVGELGRGAMGVVYKARDPQIDRLVAVKTVSLWGQEPEEEAEFRGRFMNEAKAAGRLHHAGIVAIYDVGEDPENNEPYIVLEYIAGETLNRILAREKKLPLPQALRLAQEIAEALDYAHAQGVVHRDVKPANILVTEGGHAKIADFGIAKLNLAHFTLPGRMLGTPAYMAPEQLTGDGVDGRSDLFSLGVILYAMVTGHSPFQGNSATTVCFKVANREPLAASALDLNLPHELDEVISKAMAKDPEARYQKGSEFADAMRRLLEQFDPVAVAASAQKTLATRAAAARSRQPESATDTKPDEMAQAANVFRALTRKAPIRDLVLAAATITILVIVGAQMKLLVRSSKGGDVDRAAVNNGGQSSVSAQAAPLAAAHETANPVTSADVVPAIVEEATASRKAANRPMVVPRANAKVRKERVPTTVVQAPAEQVPVVLPAMLDVAIQHQFKDATLYLWVDDQLVLSRPLHGAAQKHLVVFNGVKGAEAETVNIPAGKHSLRVRALSNDQTIDISKTISVDCAAGDRKSLQVSLDKHNSMRLLLQ
jgi:serine/threonine-protein kinase